MSILFQTERLIVRPLTPADKDAFFAVNGNPEVVRHIRPAKSPAECDAFLSENINLYHPGSLIGRYAAVLADSGEMIGIFSFLTMNDGHGIHLGYALTPGAWGKGYATELAVAGTAYFFSRTHHPRLFAITSAANEASGKVLLKAGFRLEHSAQENGRMVDTYLINRNLDPNAPSPGSSSGA